MEESEERDTLPFEVSWHLPALDVTNFLYKAAWRGVRRQLTTCSTGK